LAEPLREAVGDEALVLTPELKQQMELLLARCRARDGLVEGLGPSARTRYRAGVRALFVGPSGTGKTLAAGWLATKLSLPLYRVDLASVTSKYIGETEKNLAQLFALAEHGDLLLLFDEADSLFGKRTDVRDSNDRFANAQTNYLLQRIESFEGIAVLTSNSKSRFDTAFMRRLDAIVDFPPPAPAERRALWEAHLGQGHAIPPREFGRLVAVADLTGGQIRNVVLTAAVLAHGQARPIELGDILRAMADEYRKVGRDLPSELRAVR
jgi:SpoVK/Ycf46/Vps4 family AAA+-type ATPase